MQGPRGILCVPTAPNGRYLLLFVPGRDGPHGQQWVICASHSAFGGGPRALEVLALSPSLVSALRLGQHSLKLLLECGEILSVL